MFVLIVLTQDDDDCASNFDYSPNFQLVHSAYATMLGHLRTNALESFKSRLEQSLNQGEGFENAVRDSRQSCLLVFDKGCKGESSYYKSRASF